MRAIQLLTLALLATAVRADNFSNISISAEVLENFDSNHPERLPVPGCSVDGQGTTSASASFACEFNNVEYSGSGFAETGLGPYGIGAEVGVGASGNDLSSTPPLAAVRIIQVPPAVLGLPHLLQFNETGLS